MNRDLQILPDYYLPVSSILIKGEAHLSSLIVSGQISRGEALNK